jgi:hypothetical protein
MITLGVPVRPSQVSSAIILPGIRYEGCEALPLRHRFWIAQKSFRNMRFSNLRKLTVAPRCSTAAAQNAIIGRTAKAQSASILPLGISRFDKKYSAGPAFSREIHAWRGALG